ncbi:AraC family transcriptional regulator [Dactylosporangium sp. NPDC051485]|uniref:AraC family transcriptional regulator n=1 Tax=Dactylosporangium sp. NPDC051485 TaxID=3154846 RepID=UPI003412BC06
MILDYEEVGLRSIHATRPIAITARNKPAHFRGRRMPGRSEARIQRVVDFMHENIGEPLTISDLARVVSFSKFHFTRVFQRVTGMSPGRFLSAIRLEEAKRLLLTTSLKITDISLSVGYTSVGTFSSRFTRSVGLTPTAYRQLHGQASEIHQLPALPSGGVLSGRALQRPADRGGPIYIGLFPGPIPEGRPARCTVLDGPGPFRLDRVPTGSWFVLAHSIAVPIDGVDVAHLHEHRVTIGSVGPLTVSGTTNLGDVALQLRPMRGIDPPVLLALLEVRRGALRAAHRQDLAA